jgi:hypothetical protein
VVGEGESAETDREAKLVELRTRCELGLTVLGAAPALAALLVGDMTLGDREEFGVASGEGLHHAQ